MVLGRWGPGFRILLVLGGFPGLLLVLGGFPGFRVLLVLGGFQGIVGIGGYPRDEGIVGVRGFPGFRVLLVLGGASRVWGIVKGTWAFGLNTGIKRGEIRVPSQGGCSDSLCS